MPLRQTVKILTRVNPSIHAINVTINTRRKYIDASRSNVHKCRDGVRH